MLLDPAKVGLVVPVGATPEAPRAPLEQDDLTIAGLKNVAAIETAQELFTEQPELFAARTEKVALPNPRSTSVLASKAAPKTDVDTLPAPLPAAPVLAMAVEVKPLPTLPQEGAPPVIAEAEPVADATTVQDVPVRIAAQGTAPALTSVSTAPEVSPLLDWAGDAIRQMPQSELAASPSVQERLPEEGSRASGSVPPAFAELPPFHWAPELGVELEPAASGRGLSVVQAAQGAKLPEWATGSSTIVLAANGWRVT